MMIAEAHEEFWRLEQQIDAQHHVVHGASLMIAEAHTKSSGDWSNR